MIFTEYVENIVQFNFYLMNETRENNFVIYDNLLEIFSIGFCDIFQMGFLKSSDC